VYERALNKVKRWEKYSDQDETESDGTALKKRKRFKTLVKESTKLPSGHILDGKF